MGQGSVRGSALEELRQRITLDRLSRRDVLKRSMALGLGAPAIAALLAACGDDDDGDDTGAATATPAGGGQAAPTAATGGQAPTPTTAAAGTQPPSAAATPTTASSPETSPTTATGTGQGRGAGDIVRLLWWQAPTILNSHLSQGSKDYDAAALILEPLISFNGAGEVVPILAAEAPSIENGLVAEDGMSVTYKLKEGLVWSDGEPVTAEDVRFTWEYNMNEATTSTNFSSFQVTKDVEIVDELTVTLHFDAPNPAWFTTFSTGLGVIVPKHVLQDFVGEKARDAPFNLNPVGTGPYRVKEFRPGDVVLYEINENYREADKPYFKTVELKGGGDATSAARAVLETGEVDWSWNLQVEASILQQMGEASDTGDLQITPGNAIERILVNRADPNTEVDGARSEPSTQHPFLQFLEVRQAFALGVDRDTIAGQFYGPAGAPTANLLVSPAAFVSPNTSYEFNPEKGAEMLDAAGWTGSPRSKDGVEMRVIYQTTVNPVRQKNQEVVKQAWESMGVSVELKSIDAGVYFSSDAGNPDTAAHFYADFEMFTNGPSSPYPISYMRGWTSAEIASKANAWSGNNYERWSNAEYDELAQQAETELDPAKQAELFIAMNDLVVNDVVDIAEVHRASVTGVSKKLKGYATSPWTSDTWDIANWYMEE